MVISFDSYVSCGGFMWILWYLNIFFQGPSGLSGSTSLGFWISCRKVMRSPLWKAYQTAARCPVKASLKHWQFMYNSWQFMYNSWQFMAIHGSCSTIEPKPMIKISARPQTLASDPKTDGPAQWPLDQLQPGPKREIIENLEVSMKSPRSGHCCFISMSFSPVKFHFGCSVSAHLHFLQSEMKLQVGLNMF